MEKLELMNNHLACRPIRETKTVGGAELITKTDVQNRYSKGEVVYVDANLPLNVGDVVLYDKNNGDSLHINNELITVLAIANIVGRL